MGLLSEGPVFQFPLTTLSNKLSEGPVQQFPLTTLANMLSEGPVLEADLLTLADLARGARTIVAGKSYTKPVSQVALVLNGAGVVVDTKVAQATPVWGAPAALRGFLLGFELSLEAQAGITVPASVSFGVDTATDVSPTTALVALVAGNTFFVPVGVLTRTIPVNRSVSMTVQVPATGTSQTVRVRAIGWLAP